MGYTIAETAHKILGKCTLISTLVITIYIIFKLHFWLQNTPPLSSIYISIAQKMSREHLWIMQSVQRLIDLKTKHHYYSHGMHYWLHLGFGTPLPYRNHQI